MENIQEIILKTDINSEWTKNILDLYCLYSNLDQIEENAKSMYLDRDLKALIDILEIGAKKHYFYNFKNVSKKIQIFNDMNNIIVCFSGGKDSTATAIKYKELGYNVYLYHVHGINSSYHDEYLRAQNIADYLDLPLYIEDISLKGKNTFLEHPLKNQVICSMALDYAIKNNLGVHVAFGDCLDDCLANSSFDRDWSDAQEIMSRLLLVYCCDNSL